MYYVYMIESQQSGIFYKGSTSDYVRRLTEHNEGINEYKEEKALGYWYSFKYLKLNLKPWYKKRN